MNVSISLNFFGRTEEAINFYQNAIGAELLFLMRFHESPDQSNLSAEMGHKIFHATFRVGTVEFIASDVGCEQTPIDSAQGLKPCEGFSVALNVKDEGNADEIYAALSVGGDLKIPMSQTFFAARYAIVTDRFGITWKVVVKSRDE